MTEILKPIVSLDRHNAIERRLDDLLNRYVESDFNTFDPFASIIHLLDTYLAVVRRRNKVRRKPKKTNISVTELSALALITQATQDEICRHIQIAIDELEALEDAKVREPISKLEKLKKYISVLANKDQANISSTAREPTKINQIVRRLYEKNRSITSTEVKAAMKDMVGEGEVVAIDDVFVEIYDSQPDGKFSRPKPYKLSGIPNILSRIKNPRK
jgi:hypothetical protein